MSVQNYAKKMIYTKKSALLMHTDCFYAIVAVGTFN